jgi:hypothetical protein
VPKRDKETGKKKFRFPIEALKSSLRVCRREPSTTLHRSKQKQIKPTLAP